MSVLHPKADIETQPLNVRFVPKADICNTAKKASSESQADMRIARAVARTVVGDHARL
jgi:hypothetical protein